MTNLALLTSGACYVLPKLGSFLTEQPAKTPTTALGNVQLKFCNFHQAMVSFIGPKKWSIFCELIVENAWISVLAVESIKFKDSSISIRDLSFAFGISCTISWLIRRGLALQAVQRRLKALNQEIANIVGEKDWKTTCSIVSDHAWISTLATIFIMRDNKSPLTFERVLPIPTLFFSFCTISWLVSKGTIAIFRKFI